MCPAPRDLDAGGGPVPMRIGTSRRRPRLVLGFIVAVLLLPVTASLALAHPLGNFTINHYAGIRVEPQRVLLDVVIDQAEIPTFQAIMNLDEDGDGEFSDEELATAEHDGCVAVGEALTLTVGGAAAPLSLVEAGVTFPPGNGGLSTMRQVCTYEAALAEPIATGTPITFSDAFEPSRIGWREITVVGSGVTISGNSLRTETTTDRLTTYPSGLTGAPDDRDVSFTVTPGGPPLPPFDVPDADPIGPVAIGAAGASTAPSPSATASAPAPSARATTPTAPPPDGATMPGGIEGDSGSTSGSTGPGAVPGGEGPIPEILRTLPVSPAIALLSLLTAALLGAGHALTPGHGKTLMAAYLVGTRGTPRHAFGLGAAVSISHTMGILALAVVILAAESALPPDLVVRVAPVVAALTIVAIGGWMLAREVRRWVAGHRTTVPVEEHVHPHDPEAIVRVLAAHDPPAGDDAVEHEHGGARHRHVPPGGATITWRSLFILGLAGGLIPSTNALLILLATIAAGQPAWGVVLVVGFGLGMAGVMTGVGLGFVYARGVLERGATRPGVGRIVRFVPLGAAVLVLGVGLVLTTQALEAARLA